jgi:hypothetical protein
MSSSPSVQLLESMIIRSRKIHLITRHKESGKQKAGKFLVKKFEFRGNFGTSLKGDFHEFKVTPNLELLSRFWHEFGESLKFA